MGEWVSERREGWETHDVVTDMVLSDSPLAHLNNRQHLP